MQEMRQSINQSLMRNSFVELQENNSMLQKMTQMMQRDSALKSQKSFETGMSFTKEDEYIHNERESFISEKRSSVYLDQSRDNSRRDMNQNGID